MKKSIKEGSMSDVDLMAKEASSFKEFVKEFYKEFRDFPKTREAMKWLEDTYKSVSEGTESDELERVADGLPQTVEEMINEISLSSAGVRDFLRALYRNNNILKKLGFSNFKGAVDYIRSNGGRDWDELRDEATGFGLKFESVNEALGNDKSMLALVDILSNSMEHYDEKDFLQTIRGGQGWSGIAGFQNSSLIPIFKSIYKKYWTVSPKNRTNWSSKDWIKWLKPFGLEESITKESVNEAPNTGERIQNLNNRIKALKDKISATKSPEQKKLFSDRLVNALQTLSNIKKDHSIKAPHRESIKEESPCWDGYKQVGMKDKGGKQVPNCVPNNESVNEGVKLSLVDPNTNKFIKTLSLSRTYKEAEKEVETLNRRLSSSQKTKGLYWKVTSIGEAVTEEAKRDYKAEYKKFQSSTESKKYRAELNKYNRDNGTYGNGDGKDASHKNGKIVGFEAESINRGRAEKSRLKKESTTNEAGCGCGCNTCGGSNLTENIEPTIISQLKDIVKHNQSKVLVDPKSGKKMRVDLYSASAITQVYDAFKQQSNKDKFVGSGLIAMQSIAMKLLK